jgi:tRNA (cmo5U34)-methyltransferase
MISAALGAATLSVRRNIAHAGCKIIAVDNSPAMVERCRRHIDAYKAPTPVEVWKAIFATSHRKRLNGGAEFHHQFLEPGERQPLLDKVYQG